MRTSPFSIRVLGLGVAVLLAGCGSGTSSTTTTSSVAPTASSTSTSAAPTQSQSTPTPVSIAPSTVTSHLTDVRAAAQSGGDRVVFEFDGNTVPGYAIAYGPGVASEGGATMTANGAKQLVVKFQAASTVDLTGGIHQYYTGPKTITPSGTSEVVELKQAQSFENVLNWVIGTKTEAPFHVTTMTAPARIVIDFGS